MRRKTHKIRRYEEENPDPLTVGLIVAGVVGTGVVGYLVYQRLATPATPATPAATAATTPAITAAQQATAATGSMTNGAWYSLLIPAGTTYAPAAGGQTLQISTEVSLLQSAGSVNIVSQSQAANGDITLVFQWNGATGTALPLGGFQSGGQPTLTQITAAQAQTAQTAANQAAVNAEATQSNAAAAAASAAAGP